MVAKAKLDNDPHYKYESDHRKLMKARLTQELHQNAGVPGITCLGQIDAELILG